MTIVTLKLQNHYHVSLNKAFIISEHQGQIICCMINCVANPIHMARVNGCVAFFVAVAELFKWPTIHSNKGVLLCLWHALVQRRVPKTLSTFLEPETAQISRLLHLAIEEYGRNIAIIIEV